MNNNQVAHLDMDGTIVDFVKGICEIHKVNNPYYDIYNKPVKSMLGVWNFASAIGMTDAEFYVPLKHDFWANLELLPDAMAIVELLEKRFGPENICFFSSPSRCDTSYSGKRAWLSKHFPDYFKGGRYILGSHKFFAAGPDNILIDDADHNIKAYKKRKGVTILVPRLWNSLHSADTLDYLESQLELI